LVELAQLAVRVAGRGTVPRAMPAPLAEAVARAGAAASRVTGRPPLLPRGQLTFLRWNARPDSAKAQRELGWTPTPLEEGMRRTLAHLGLL
jgi:nucleoside-diphosphate-sugar epimerase